MAADFSNFTSPESDAAAVDSIVSQAIDSAILEQIAEINSSDHLSSLPAQEAEIKVTSKNLNGKKQLRTHESKPQYPLSPPRNACCFGCSSLTKTKKDARLKGENYDEILTDYSTFSFKEQQRKLKKAIKEEEKASREAEKVVEWVKQASARMDVSAIDELLSEDDEKHHK